MVILDRTPKGLKVVIRPQRIWKSVACVTIVTFDIQ